MGPWVGNLNPDAEELSTLISKAGGLSTYSTLSFKGRSTLLSALPEDSKQIWPVALPLVFVLDMFEAGSKLNSAFHVSTLDPNAQFGIAL